jgi:hypothetical protein
MIGYNVGGIIMEDLWEATTFSDMNTKTEQYHSK